MSGHGAPEEQALEATGLEVVIVAGTWHDVITDGLIAGAERVLTASGARWRLVRVPGSFELPVACKTALEAGADAVVALGVIIRGGTPHFEYVSSGIAKGVFQVSMELDLPVAFGVLTCDSLEQALERSGAKGGNKGFEAAMAAVEMADLRARLRAPGE